MFKFLTVLCTISARRSGEVNNTCELLTGELSVVVDPSMWSVQ
jgi:hypothetical protein